MGSTAVLLIGWRAILYKVFPVDNSKKSDVYRRGNPFELFEVPIYAIPCHECFFANRLFLSLTRYYDELDNHS